ncbi:MAG TPA: flagellar biosynthetic protein FliR [Magnetospirillaceae bacterium]|jgi:flagellar biosynthetic protein FliR
MPSQMLREFAALNVFHFLLIFARLGTVVMFMPAISSTMIPPRTRLLLALLLAFIITPLVTATMPDRPKEPLALAFMFATEITVGLYLGMLMQMLMSAIDLAGNFMGYSMGITNALISDPTTEQQSQLISGFLNLASATLMLLTNTHHLILRAIVDSYTLFTPGAPLPMGDFSSQLVTTLGASFMLGLKLAAPLFIFSLVFNVGLGLLNRLVPQMQVFFVGMPMQILGGLAILSLSMAAILYGYIQYFGHAVDAYLAPG